jgi:hypothetical protein
MWRLGADPGGYATNFVESEHIVQSTASYVQGADSFVGRMFYAILVGAES